jgi:hypothetical protein
VVASILSPGSQAARAAVKLGGPRRAGPIMRLAASMAAPILCAMTFFIEISLIGFGGA